jgi:hypothetical protein
MQRGDTMNFSKMLLMIVACAGLMFGQATAIPSVAPGTLPVSVDKAVTTKFTLENPVKLAVSGSGYFPFNVWVPESYQNVLSITPTSGFLSAGQEKEFSLTFNVQDVPVGVYNFPVIFVGTLGNNMSVSLSVTLNVMNSFLNIPDTPVETDRFVSHVAAGGGWKTTLRVSNKYPSQMKTFVVFKNNNGQTKTFRVNGQTVFELPLVLAPNTVMDLVVDSDGALETGVASVKAASENVAGVNVIYSSAEPQFSTSVNLTPSSNDFSLYFNNTGRNSTGMAVGNNSMEFILCMVKIYSKTGELVSVESLVVPPLGSKVFVLDNIFPVVRGMEGMLRIETGEKSISVFGIQFDLDSGVFYMEPGA